jgi:plastocyanin
MRKRSRLVLPSIHSTASAASPVSLASVLGILLGIAAAASPAAAGTLTGHVRLEGPRPTPPIITMSADPACDRQFPKGRPAETIVTGADGSLANVIVHVTAGFPKKFAFPPFRQSSEVTIDQKGCAYVPHVLAVRVGEEITIRNSDATIHNVSARSIENPPFNEATPGEGFVLRKTFRQPEIAVKLKCDIHPWMAAYVGVFEHPYFAVTGSDGSFTITGLPESEYTVEAWHESLGVQSAAVELDDDSATARLDFSFAGN